MDDEIELIPIEADGRSLVDAGSLPAVARGVCTATVAHYRNAGFVPPWICYLIQRDAEIIGTCAFKQAPIKSAVEIAYFTFPEHERQGVATAAARELIQIARQNNPRIRITAQTLPEKNASNAILVKLGFVLAGEAVDDDVGRVWEWHLEPGRGEGA